MQFRMFALALVSMSAISFSAHAEVTIFTTPFITSPVAAANFDAAPRADYGNGTSYSEGGVKLTYTGAGGFGDTAFVQGGTWGAIGNEGFTTLKLASGASFNQLQFQAASDWGGGPMQYELMNHGSLVATGSVGSLLPSFDGGQGNYKTFGFSGATFDTVLLQNNPFTGSNAFDPNAADGLFLDNILIGNASANAFSTKEIGFAGLGNTYGLAYDGTNFTVSMNLSTGSTVVDPEVLQQWALGIEGTWDAHTVSTPLGDIPLVFDVDFNDPSLPFDALLNVHNEPCRSSVFNWCVNPITDTTGVPDLSMRGEVAAHEFGHLLGLYDEYVGGGTDPSASAGDLCTPHFFDHIYIGSSGTFCNSLMADFGPTQPRYYDRILAQIAANTGFTPTLGNSPILSPLPPTDPGPNFTGILEGGVPEPSAWLLLIMGFAFVGQAVRKRGTGTLRSL